MAIIKQIKLPEDTTTIYDIAAKYDINNNEITATYLNKTSTNVQSIASDLIVGGNITEDNQTLSDKYAAKKADQDTFGGVKIWNEGTILYIKNT